MNHEVLGEHFLPPDKAARAIDAGNYPMNPLVHPPSFWHSVVTGEPYRVRAFWIVGSNPLLTMTHSLEVEEALKLMEFVVVSDFFLTPTAQLADLVLPAATWLEQEDVVNLHKIWSVLARKKLAQIGECRDDREVIIQLAHRLGLQQAFPWSDLRAFHEWTLEETGLSFSQFCEQGIIQGEMRYKKYATEGFQTPSGKFEIYSERLKSIGVAPLPVYREPPITPMSAPDIARDYPLILTNSGKIREFFLSEGRQIEPLRRSNPDPLVEIHPDMAASLEIRDGDWVWVETRAARVKMRAKLFDGVAQDVVAVQFGWWFPERQPPEYGWKESSANLLYGDSEYDPDTGSESLHSDLCRVYPTI
jgi:anaerobic selenocysteine-containing dehydrogenase